MHAPPAGAGFAAEWAIAVPLWHSTASRRAQQSYLHRANLCRRAPRTIQFPDRKKKGASGKPDAPRASVFVAALYRQRILGRQEGVGRLFRLRLVGNFNQWFETRLAVVVVTCAGRDDVAHDDIFLEAAQI